VSQIGLRPLFFIHPGLIENGFGCSILNGTPTLSL
jgi:hypothetical protein